MKYFVRIGDTEIELSREGDDVLVDSTTTSARLADVEGTPVRMLTVGDEVHRIVVRPAGPRGRYTIWVDGFRHEVEALDERAASPGGGHGQGRAGAARPGRREGRAADRARVAAYGDRGLRPGAIASRPNRARTLSIALETSRSFAVSSGVFEPSNRASCTAGG
jgi:hypothetical protein